jgi:uncharacterized protein
MLVEREMYMSRIRPFIGKDIVKVLTGIRRSGKSVMLELIKKELGEMGVSDSNFFSYNFEDLALSSLCTAEALNNEILRRRESTEGKVYLFFDEIQEVMEWEKVVNSLRVTIDCDIYITGSNAKLLSSELSTYLAGRYVEFVIYPFSFREFLTLYRLSFPDEGIPECFRKYMTLGGMPYLSVLNYNSEAAKIYLEDTYTSIALKDIAKRNNIRDIDLLERVMAYLSGNIGRTFSALSISRYFKSEFRKVSVDTLLNYIRFSMEAFLLYQVKREDVAGKEILSTNEKYYIADQGLREAKYGNNEKDVELVLENIVFMELLRRGYTVHTGRVGDKEIDFIATRQSEKIYVQVTYLLAGESTIEREFGVYSLVSDNWPKYVVSMDEFNMSRDGIKHMNVRDFLLADKWN